MTCWGIRKDGSQMLLGDPVEMVLSYDRDAPADQLKATFPADGLWENLVQVVVYEGGYPVFRGVVDEQNTRLSDRGVQVELVCRSMEALLLDNEACPGSVNDPSLKNLCAKFLEPLGFTRIEGPEDVIKGVLEIEKGVSCWQVLAGFCRRWPGITPYVDRDGVLRCEEIEEREELVTQVLWAEISRKPCKEISEIFQQSFRGVYDTRYREPSALAVRRRYVSNQSGVNPRDMLAEAREAGYRVTLECGGVVWPARGRLITADLPRLGRVTRCPVVSARCYRDSRGLRTRLTLERGEETCG